MGAFGKYNGRFPALCIYLVYLVARLHALRWMHAWLHGPCVHSSGRTITQVPMRNYNGAGSHAQSLFQREWSNIDCARRVHTPLNGRGQRSCASLSHARPVLPP